MLGRKLICIVSSLALAGSLVPALAFAQVLPGDGGKGTDRLHVQATSTGPSLSVTRVASGKVVLKKGSSYKLGVSAAKGANVRYKSSKKNVVTVSKAGKVKARKAGKAVVTVKAKKAGKTTTRNIKVTVVRASKYKQVKKLTASAASTKLELGASTKIAVSFNPKKASNRNVAFKSSKPAVATVSAKGTVKAVASGTTTVTVTSCANPKAKAKVKLTVTEAQGGVGEPDPADDPSESNVEEYEGWDADSDGDGYSDYVERTFMGTDPDVADEGNPAAEDVVVYDETAQRVDAAIMDGIGSAVAQRPLEADGSGAASVTVPKDGADYSAGKVVVVEPCDAYPAGASVKVERAEDNGDGTVTLEGSRPELADVVTYSNIEEELEPDWDEVRAAPGVEVEVEDAEAGEQTLLAQSAGGMLKAAGIKAGGQIAPLKKKATFKFDSDSLNKGKDDVTSRKWGLDVSGELTVAIDDVRFAFEAVPNYKKMLWSSIPTIVKEGVDLKRLYLDVEGDVKLKITGEVKDKTTILLGEIPVYGALGEGVFIKILLVGNASGSIQVKMATDYEVGVDCVKDREPNLIGNFTKPNMETTTKVELKIGPEVRPVAALFGLELLTVGANAGVKAQASAVLHSRPAMLCADVDAWVFASVYAEAIKDIDWVELKVSHDFWDESNSPDKMAWHFENGELVDSCTWVAEPGNVDTEVQTGVEVREDFADYSWSELKEISGYIAAADDDEEGLAIAKRYHLTDDNGQLYDPQHPLTHRTKPLALSDGTQTYVEILGFRHDTLTGGGKAGITFGFAESPMSHAVNSKISSAEEGSIGNRGGWEASEMRTWLNGEFFRMLPDDLRPYIAAANKLTNNTGRVEEGDNSNHVTVTSDRLWLLSAVECVYPFTSPRPLLDRTCAASTGEGAPYKLYTDGWTEEDGGCGLWKDLHYDGSVFHHNWWLRTPYVNDGVSFTCIDNWGGWDDSSADYKYGVSPGFCL